MTVAANQDAAAGWELRMALKEKWPNTSVSSLGAGNQSERAWKFRWDQLHSYPDNLLLLKHIAKSSTRYQELVAEDGDEEESDFT